jgi:hypothetical protein
MDNGRQLHQLGHLAEELDQEIANCPGKTVPERLNFLASAPSLQPVRKERAGRRLDCVMTTGTEEGRAARLSQIVDRMWFFRFKTCAVTASRGNGLLKPLQPF